MQPEEITDRESLEAWLKTRSREENVWIAHRAAARVAPIWYNYVNSMWTRKGIQLRQDVPLANVISSVGTFMATDRLGRVWRYLEESSAMFNFNGRAAVYAAGSTVRAAPRYAAAACGAADYISKYSGFWEVVSRDCRLQLDGETIDAVPLWHNQPNPLESQWQATRTEWQAPNSPYRFWLRWYEAALQGRHLNLDLEYDIALIPEEDWEKGPDHIATLIDALEAKHRASVPQPNIAQDLAKLQPGTSDQVANVRQAMVRNRAALPPTFDAIQGLILIELERLQNRNYTDELDQLECQRQIATYLSLYQAVDGLRSQLPSVGDPTDQQAEQSEGLLRLYADKFKALPRAKADEVVEGVWSALRGGVQGSLILATSSLFVSYGFPVAAGVATGALVFAPNRAGEILKAAKEIWVQKGPGTS